MNNRPNFKRRRVVMAAGLTASGVATAALLGTAQGNAQRGGTASQNPGGGIPEQGDSIRGVFSPVVNWPFIPIHAVMTKDGRVLTYGSTKQGFQSGMFFYDVWSPFLGTGPGAHQTLPNTTQVDLFCSSQLNLADGTVGIFGGDVTVGTSDGTGYSTNAATNSSITIYNPAASDAKQQLLKQNSAMLLPRWYSTATVLPNNEIYLQGGTGGNSYPEIRGVPDGAHRLLNGAYTGGYDDWYPRNFVGPNGKIFGKSGARFFEVDTRGNGSVRTLNSAAPYNPFAAGSRGEAVVMFAPGRILVVGTGGDARTASVIDINRMEASGSGASSTPSVVPTVVSTSKLKRPRTWGHATVLPNGQVFVNGGSLGYNELATSSYTSELYEPATNTWTDGAVAAHSRMYHATSLLLADGTVLTGGGGASTPTYPGPEFPANTHAEIYYPPYLFNADGTRATRPAIDSAPLTATAGGVLTLTSADAGSIKRITLVKTGSTTHSFNMEQRFIELAFVQQGVKLDAALTNDRHQFTPGMYMVFVINANGVPSEASLVRIDPSPTLAATATRTLRIMPLGDALTYGYINLPGTNYSGYRAPLQELLAQKTLNYQFVGSIYPGNGVYGIDTHHEGHPGMLIGDMTAYAGNWVRTAKPGFVLLQMGFTDMLTNYQVDTAPARLGKLVDTIRAAAPGVKIVLSTLAPTPDAATQARIGRFNAQVVGLANSAAAQYGDVFLVDAATLVPKIGVDYYDALYPNDAGHRKLAGIWLDGIVRALQSTAASKPA
jgi:hypothetical protein